MQANLVGESMVITAKKLDKGNVDFVPIKDRQRHENRGSPWSMKMDYDNSSDPFGNVTSNFLNDTLKEMENNLSKSSHDKVRIKSPESKGWL